MENILRNILIYYSVMLILGILSAIVGKKIRIVIVLISIATICFGSWNIFTELLSVFEEKVILAQIVLNILIGIIIPVIIFMSTCEFVMNLKD